MHPDDESAAPSPDPATDPRVRVDRQFAEMVRHLRQDDPRFVRRCSAPRRHGLARADAMIVTAVLGFVLLGVVPLAVGVHVHGLALLLVGTVGCLVAPLVAPWLVGRAIRRHRPLWT